jgi:GNAT superfamily N-acetyltransferase
MAPASDGRARTGAARAAIREARPGDAADLARIHVGAWWQTYRGILPMAAIAGRTEEDRRRLWARALRTRHTRIAIAPGLGFAQMGPQRDASLFPDRPAELWSLYVLRAGQGRGLGGALMGEAQRLAGGAAFTTWVIDGNAGAERFYRRRGGRLLSERTIRMGGMPLRERAYGFPAA